jgi:ATP-dependent Clp protease ATP-binding subunit ClpB
LFHHHQPEVPAVDLNRFTEKAREALAGSQTLAARLNHQSIDIEHVLLNLLDQPKGLAAAILNKAGVPAEDSPANGCSPP